MSGLNRRQFLGAGAVLGALPFCRVANAQDKRPNILLIMADDMGYSDPSPFGGEIDTPNIAWLAREGMRVTSFYNNSMCVPARASLLTGLYPHAVKAPDEPNPTKTNCVTLAEALKLAGYRTLMAGKWHRPGKPVERGFDRHFGLLDGACNFFNPGHARPGEPEPARKFPYQEHRWAVEDKEYKPYTPPETDFYTTDAFTSYAIDRLEEYKDEKNPFFLYMAYNAPHYPMQAWPEDIAKYRGKYMLGWEKLREQRYKRQLELGIIDPRWELPPRDEDAPVWDEVEDKDAWDLKMAVYAAMVDRLDQNIGRLFDKLREIGKLDNTLIIFLSDNGGSFESFHVNPESPPGVMTGFHTVDLPWANASNTPFRKCKFWNHEGGISAPFIARWPGVIEPGSISRQMGHLIDFMPTFLDVAGADYPDGFEGRKTLPMDGVSLVPVFKGKTLERDTLCWQYGKSRAIRKGAWKLVAGNNGPWELYDMDADRTEQHNLAEAQPERVAAMSAEWDAWADRVGAKSPQRGEGD